MEAVKYRAQLWENLLYISFALNYHAHMDIAYIDSLSPVERDWYFHKLEEQKNNESEAMDKAVREAKSK